LCKWSQTYRSNGSIVKLKRHTLQVAGEGFGPPEVKRGQDLYEFSIIHDDNLECEFIYFPTCRIKNTVLLRYTDVICCIASRNKVIPDIQRENSPTGRIYLDYIKLYFMYKSRYTPYKCTRPVYSVFRNYFLLCSYVLCAEMVPAPFF